MGGTSKFARLHARTIVLAACAAILLFSRPASARLFEQPFLFAVPTVTTSASLTGDFGGDGHLDLLLAPSGTATVYRGDGALNFSSIQSFSYAPAPSDVALGDVNGDGKPDLVTPGLVKLN